MPRQHQQMLFTLLDELLAGRKLAELELDAIVYGRGPGSFTGLRIAVSAAQGLAFSLGTPVVGVSSLETQLRSFLRQEPFEASAMILSCIDARIGQIYGQWFSFDGAELLALGEAFVAPPEAVERPSHDSARELPWLAVGSGAAFVHEMSPVLQDRLTPWPKVLPEAQDMLETARRALVAGQGQDPLLAAPDYVQTRIGWKTLAEQGRSA